MPEAFAVGSVVRHVSHPAGGGHYALRRCYFVHPLSLEVCESVEHTQVLLSRSLRFLDVLIEVVGELESGFVPKIICQMEILHAVAESEHQSLNSLVLGRAISYFFAPKLFSNSDIT